MVTPLPGSYCPVYQAYGTAQDFSNEAMEEVSDPRYPAHTVYRIAAPAKRNFWDSAVPTFQLQTHGAGDFNPVTPDYIWHPAGYIRFTAAHAKNADDVIRCATGKYKTYTQLFGCATKSWTNKPNTAEITMDMDTIVRRAITSKDWNATIEAFWARLQAEYITTGGATNGNVRYQHIEGGAAGDLISVVHSNPGGNNALAVAVSDQEITVTLRTVSGVIQSTAREVINAVNGSAAVKALKVRASYAPGENGTGIVGAFAHTHLAGGLDEINYDSLLGVPMLFKFFENYSVGTYWIGYGMLESLPWVGKPSDFLKLTMRVSGARHSMYRVVE